jgi:hypothetical protein
MPGLQRMRLASSAKLRGDNQDGLERRSGWMTPGLAEGRA